MPDSSSHYQVLEVTPTASAAVIKAAYRRLAKALHPDRNGDVGHEAIARLNVAYEVLSDPLARRVYDQQRDYVSVGAVPRHERDEAAAQRVYRRRPSEPSTDAQLKDWLRQVYTPGIRAINQIIKPLKAEVRALSADPFDDQLMDAFVAYIEASRASLEKIERAFRSVPNPPTIAGIAAHIYYCLNQLSDALNELEYFTMNYNEDSLHTGCEMFRIAQGLMQEAQGAVREIPK
jgi:molecular chaperone DnaJ